MLMHVQDLVRKNCKVMVIAASEHQARCLRDELRRVVPEHMDLIRVEPSGVRLEGLMDTVVLYDHFTYETKIGLLKDTAKEYLDFLDSWQTAAKEAFSNGQDISVTADSFCQKQLEIQARLKDLLR